MDVQSIRYKRVQEVNGSSMFEGLVPKAEQQLLTAELP